MFPWLAASSRVLVPGLFLLAGAADLRAQTLTGTLLSMEGDRPVASGVVELLRAEDAQEVAVVVTGEDGRFRLEAPEAGTYIVRGRAPFHHPLVDGPVELGEDEILEVQFRLTTSPVVLDGIEVEVEARSARLEGVGFHERRRRGFGHFLDEEEIDRRPLYHTSDLVRHLPRVHVVQPPMGPPVVLFRQRGSLQSSSGYCRPTVYVDGFPQLGSETPVNDIPSYDIAGLEVYPSQTTVPAQYAGGLTGCGVILIWTRR